MLCFLTKYILQLTIRVGSVMFWYVKFLSPPYLLEKNPCNKSDSVGDGCLLATTIISSLISATYWIRLEEVAWISLCTLWEAPPNHTCLISIIIETFNSIWLSVISRLGFILPSFSPSKTHPSCYLISGYFLRWGRTRTLVYTQEHE